MVNFNSFKFGYKFYICIRSIHLFYFFIYGGGLNKFNYADNTFSHYHEKDGLPNNTIYGILEDNNGNLWLSTNRGLSKFNPNTEDFRNYDVYDGLQSNEFNLAYY